MVYHASLSTEGCRFVCGLPILGLNGKGTSEPDIVDQTLEFFRANLLFRNFQVQGPADKLLIYITMFLQRALKSRCFVLNFES